jgi:hypothetical protein
MGNDADEAEMSKAMVSANVHSQTDHPLAVGLNVLHCVIQIGAWASLIGAAAFAGITFPDVFQRTDTFV